MLHFGFYTQVFGGLGLFFFVVVFCFVLRFYLFYVYEHLPECVSVHHMCAAVLTEGIRSLGPAVIDKRELSCGCWNRTQVLWYQNQTKLSQKQARKQANK